jgi:transcriptional regulator with XRE-family HTH domain
VPTGSGRDHSVERLREERGLTQEQLGWAAGIHQTAIARGERRPPLGTVFTLAAGLEVRPARLFERHRVAGRPPSRPDGHLTSPSVTLTVMQIDRYIEVLEDFERKYHEYLAARSQTRALMARNIWEPREWAERERRLRTLAPRAEAAMEASGLGGYEKHWPQALGGGVMSDDLSDLIFDFHDGGFSVDATDDEMQWSILRRIPSQIEGLRIRREEAEEASREKGRRLREAFARPRSRWLHDPNPWALAFVTIVIGGLIVLAVWAAITA